MAEPGSNVARALAAIGTGDRQAADELLPYVYEELRRLAASRMARESGRRTLQPTELVHEAYLRLVGDGDVAWDSRGHFFAAAAQAMRRILVDRARRRRRVKHGGGRARVPLDDAEPRGRESVDHVVLDEALRRIEEVDGRAAQVVMLRYFAGLGVEDTAKAMGVSAMTVKRDWAFARAWLYAELSGANRDPAGKDTP